MIKVFGVGLYSEIERNGCKKRSTNTERFEVGKYAYVVIVFNDADLYYFTMREWEKLGIIAPVPRSHRQRHG